MKVKDYYSILKSPAIIQATGVEVDSKKATHYQNTTLAKFKAAIIQEANRVDVDGKKSTYEQKTALAQLKNAGVPGETSVLLDNTHVKAILLDQTGFGFTMKRFDGTVLIDELLGLPITSKDTTCDIVVQHNEQKLGTLRRISLHYDYDKKRNEICPIITGINLKDVSREISTFISRYNLEENFSGKPRKLIPTVPAKRLFFKERLY